MTMLCALAPQMAFAEAPVIGNDSYPYCSDMYSSSTATLCVDVTGGESYAWYSSDVADGQWTAVEGGTGTLQQGDTVIETNFALNKCWYKCVVSNGDGTSSTIPLEIAGTLSSKTHATYLSNGQMAYTYGEYTNSSNKTVIVFDVLGKYDGTWIPLTSYSGYWYMMSASAADSAINYYSWGDNNAILDSFKGRFSPTNKTLLTFDADLGEGQAAFAFGCDVMIRENDKAPTTAVRNSKNEDDLVQLQLVDTTGLLEEADSADAALVINTDKRKGMTPASMWYVGNYYYNLFFGFNKTNEGNVALDSKGRVYQTQGDDSGCSVSYTGLEAGSVVSFGFSLGTVADTGAKLSANVTTDDEKLVIAETESGLYYSIAGAGAEGDESPLWLKPVTDQPNTFEAVAPNTPGATEWIPSTTTDENNPQPLIIKGLKPGSNYVLKAVGNDEYADEDFSRVQSQEITTKINPMFNEDPSITPAIARHTGEVIVTGVSNSRTYKLIGESGNDASYWTEPKNGELVFPCVETSKAYYLVASDSEQHDSVKVKIDPVNWAMDYTPSTSDFVTYALENLLDTRGRNFIFTEGEFAAYCPVAGCDDDINNAFRAIASAEDAEYDGQPHGGSYQIINEESPYVHGYYTPHATEGSGIDGYFKKADDGSYSIVNGVPVDRGDYVYIVMFAGADRDNIFMIVPYSISDYVNVSFDSNGLGTAPEAMRIKKDSAATAPADPKADGYVFVGWCTDQACENLFDFSTKLSEDTILYAKWAEIPAVEPAAAPTLIARAQPSSKGVKVRWNKVAGAKGYVIYATYCDKKYKKVVKTTATSFNLKKLSGKKIDPSKAVKICVIAYGEDGAKSVVLATSSKIHIAPAASSKYGNAKKVVVKKSAICLSVGTKGKVKAKAVLSKGKKQLNHVKGIRYVSSDKFIAKVNSKGVVVAKKAGTCTIYAIAVNGKYAKIKVTVK